jgi:short-subunit dehydrogenase
MKSFKNKNAYITGAGSGMGKEMALILAKEGCNLIITDKDKSNLEVTKSLIEKYNVQCFDYCYDVGNPKEIEKYTTKALKDLGHLDILINNAGYALGAISLEEIKMEDYHNIVNVNMWGVIYHTKFLLHHLLQRPEANITNISSLFGIAGIARQVPYCTTKFAVRGFTEALRMEMMDDKNITITCVHPGGIKTNIFRNGVHYDDPKKVEAMGKKFEKALRTSAEDAAKTILNGIKNRKERVLIGLDAELMDRAARLSPVGYSKIGKSIFDKML